LGRLQEGDGGLQDFGLHCAGGYKAASEGLTQFFLFMLFQTLAEVVDVAGRLPEGVRSLRQTGKECRGSG